MSYYVSKLKSPDSSETQYKTREEARDAIVVYVEVFYNRIRRHAKLGNISPAEALRNFKLMQGELV